MEVKKIGNLFYLYRSTTRYDEARKKRVKVSEYQGKINETGLIEKNRRPIHELGNSHLLSSISDRIILGLRKSFPDHWEEIIVRAIDPIPLRLLKSAWEKFYISMQIEASPSENTISEKINIIGSDYIAQKELSRSFLMADDRILLDISIHLYSPDRRISTL
ncbi:MAG: hypothetical protein QW578_05135 [Thermoplasmatales archaeon]